MALCRARAQHRGARARARRYDHTRSPPAMDGTRHPEKAKSTQKKRCEPPAISEEARTLLQHSITITSTVALSTSTSTIKNGMTVPMFDRESADVNPDVSYLPAPATHVASVWGRGGRGTWRDAVCSPNGESLHPRMVYSS